MKSSYMKPGVAAIILALLFPIYWGYILVFGPEMNDLTSALKNEFTSLDWLDVIFVVIGGLEVYVLLGLIRALKDCLNTNLARVSIYIMIASVVLFHGTIFADIYLTLFKNSLDDGAITSVIEVSLYFAISGLIIYLVAGFILSVVLLANSREIAKELKYFSILFLIICILGATVLLSAFNLLLFPVALVILAVYFLRDPESLEVV